MHRSHAERNYSIACWGVVSGATQSVERIENISAQPAVAGQPTASGSEAAACTAVAVGWSQSKLQSQKCIHASRRIWTGIRPWKKSHPMGKGCQPGFALNPKLRAQVHTFLMRHSKETSRFCRTKQRDQKVHSHRVETLFRTTKC